jgi:dCMP deaminase
MELADHAKAIKYIQLAAYNAKLFSKDPHTQVGCIILTEDFSRILSTGINGFPRNMDDNNKSRWERPLKYSYVQHSESNAVANAARTGTPIDKSVIAITKFPCSTCAKLLVQAGIKKVYTIQPDYESEQWGEDAKISERILNEVGVEVHMFPEFILKGVGA